MTHAPHAITYIPVRRIARDPEQVRKHFDEEALQSLAGSIREQGVIQPIVVRARIGLDESNAGLARFDYDYRLIAGERRYRAAQLAGLDVIPAIVRDDLSTGQISVLQVVENLQRENLALFEVCDGVERCIAEVGFAETVKQLGKSEAWVSKHSSVMKLDARVVALVRNGRITSVDVAKELATLVEIDDEGGADMLARFAGEDQLTLQGVAGVPDDDDKDEVERAAEESAAAEAEFRNNPPTRAEIRRAIAWAKEEATIAADRESNRELMQQARAPLDDDAEQDSASSSTRDLLDPVSETKSEAAARKETVERVRAAQPAWVRERAEQLCRLIGKPMVETDDDWDGLPFKIRATYINDWNGSPVPLSVLEAVYSLDVDGTLDVVAPVLRATGQVEGIDLFVQVSLEEAHAIQRILKRDLKLDPQFLVQGDVLFKALNAEAARQAPAKEAKKKPAKLAGPETVPAFLKARVKKAAIPARRISPADLHAAYVTWCKSQKIEPISVKHNGWGQAIAEAGIEKIRSDGMWYVGIELIGAKS